MGKQRYSVGQYSVIIYRIPTYRIPTIVPQPKNSPPVSPILVLTIGIFAISVAAILIRLAQNEAVPSLVIAAWRLTIATLILLPLCLLRHFDELRWLRQDAWLPAILAGVMLAVHFAAWIASLDYTSVAAASALVATVPLWVAIASPVLLREGLTRATKVGVGLALIGTVLIAANDLGGVGRNPLLGNGLAVIGAIAAAGYLVIGRKLRTTLSLIPYITIVYGIAAITLMLTTIASRQPLFAYSPALFGLFFLIAAVPQLIGHSSFNYALGYLPAAYVTLSAIAEPVGASVLALLIFREVPTAYTIFGGILILSGIILSSRSNDG